MIKNLDKLDVNVFCIIVPGCNLSCDYCLIAKAEKTTKNKIQLLEETKKAILNGQYLNNIKNSLNRLEIDYNNLTEFEIWGGEPTLVLKELTQVWPEWQKNFSNLNTIGFSTNGINYYEDIFNFIIEIEKNAKKNITISIQYSYDGEESETEVRGCNPKINVINNLLNLIDKLNNYRFNYVNITFNLHCVLSTSTVKRLNSSEKINDFLRKYSNEEEKVYNQIINKNINLMPTELIVSNAENFTSEDGIEFQSFIKKINLLKQNNNYSLFRQNEKRYNLNDNVFGTLTRDIIDLVRYSKENNLDDYINHFLEDPNYYNQSSMCGTCTGYLRFDYNGNIYDCHGSIHDKYIDKEKIKNNINISDNTRYYSNKYGFYTNLAKDSDEKIENTIDFYYKSHDSSVLLFMFHNILNMMYLMSLIGQIDISYKNDFNKMKRHAFILAKYNQCYHTLKNRNGSIFLRGNEEIRLYCNGTLDAIEEIINKELQNNED